MAGVPFHENDRSLAETLAAAIALENARLMQTLRQNRDKLEEARNEELDTYAHTVAHDLKNPLGLSVLPICYTIAFDSLAGAVLCLDSIVEHGHEDEQHYRYFTQTGRGAGRREGETG